ncbi:MAG: hypothetical protein HYU36_16960 [Planctomycetes bacterium]|nr:hypothetical protein [Planctomycetota bacterium]
MTGSPSSGESQDAAQAARESQGPGDVGKSPAVSRCLGCLPASSRRVLAFLWRVFLGAVFCQGPLTSLLIIGWTYRLVRRFVLHQWWQHSDLRLSGTAFADFLQGEAWTRDAAGVPHWMLHPRFRETLQQSDSGPAGQPGRARRAFRALTGSLWLNLRTGLEGILNTWALTLPPALLWLFGWHGGWNNSFHKGYEEWWVGPLTGWLGVVLYTAVLFYVPLAQARQAATGRWRAFYQFRVVRALVRQRWFACALLAGLYSAVSVPVTLLKTLPVSFDQWMPWIETATDRELLDFLGRYFFWCGFAVFPSYVLLRIAAAWIYASALPAALECGAVRLEDLDPGEAATLQRVHRLGPRPEPISHPLVRAATWTGTRLARFTGGFAAAFLWFSFLAQIFISEFIHYHPFWGWLNQPLVQLPWFHYVPAHLFRP